MTIKKLLSILLCACFLFSSALVTVNATASEINEKISSELTEVISSNRAAIIPVYISLKSSVNTSEIEKYVIENYENADKDADVFLRYYRQELSKTISADIQKFVDENKALIERVIVQPDSAEFVIADVYAYNIEKIADSEIVAGIQYWKETEELQEDDGSSVIISPELTEMISTNKDAVIPVYISLKSCVNTAEIEKYVLENYENADKDSEIFSKHYRQEVSKIINVYVQRFVDENKSLIERVIVQPDSAEFVIADVYAYNIEKIAGSEIVTGIQYWEDAEEVPGNHNDYLFNEKFIEAFDVKSDEYSYEELYYHKDADDVIDWVLVYGWIGNVSPATVSATIGNILIESNNNFSPFLLGYGVYDVKEDKFYSIEGYPSLPNKLNELLDVLKELNIGTEINNPSESTEPATTESTEPITDKATEPATTESTEPITDKPTEPVTTEPTEPTTDKPTESVTTEPQPTVTDPTTPTDKPAVKKKANAVKVTVKNKAVKAKKLKSKKQSVKPLTITNAQGKVTVTLVKSGTTKKIRTKVTVSKKGVITLKKGKYKKDTYKVKLKIIVKGNSNFNPKTLIKTVTVKVK